MLLSVRARSPEMTVVVVPLMLAIFIMPLPLSDHLLLHRYVGVRRCAGQQAGHAGCKQMGSESVRHESHPPV